MWEAPHRRALGEWLVPCSSLLPSGLPLERKILQQMLQGIGVVESGLGCGSMAWVGLSRHAPSPEFDSQHCTNWVWCHVPVIPALTWVQSFLAIMNLGLAWDSWDTTSKEKKRRKEKKTKFVKKCRSVFFCFISTDLVFPADFLGWEKTGYR